MSRQTDLDPADVVEVLRRVVWPTLTCWLHPEELANTLAQVVLRPPHAWPGSRRDEHPYLELQLSVLGEEGTVYLDRLQFTHTSTDDMSDRLHDQMHDWIAESRFGWGQSRDTHPGLALGGQRWPVSLDGQPTLEFYPDWDAPGVLWRQGQPIDAKRLGLPTETLRALDQWRAQWWQAYEDENEDSVVPVLVLERLRQDLVHQLREDLEGRMPVAAPISLDPNTWLARLPPGTWQPSWT